MPHTIDPDHCTAKATISDMLPMYSHPCFICPCAPPPPLPTSLQVRNDNTEAAAKKISAAAIKKKGLRDDISVLVIDLLPQQGDVRPPALLQV